MNSRRVLFVDDDESFLETITRVFAEWSQGSWKIFTASNVGKALGLLQDQQMDLVVVDVQMPVVDGIQFLSLLSRKHPNLLKVVLSGCGTDADRAVCLSNGAELFLEKPRSQPGLESVFATLNEMIRLQPEQGFRGVLRRVALEDVLQMECLSRHSVLLEVIAGSRKGEIFVHDGSIVHAEFGEVTGEAAFYKVLGLKGGEFNLKPFVEPPARTIEGQWEFLLMEAARMRDEAAGAELPAENVENIVSLADLAQELTSTLDAAPVETPAIADIFPAPPQAVVEDLFPPRIEEMLVCSAKGDVLYEWQCPNAERRLNFLEFISQKSRQLALGLPLGRFDRIELTDGQARVVAQVQADRGVLVRSSKNSLEPQV